MRKPTLTSLLTVLAVLVSLVPSAMMADAAPTQEIQAPAVIVNADGAYVQFDRETPTLTEVEISWNAGTTWHPMEELSTGLGNAHLDWGVSGLEIPQSGDLVVRANAIEFSGYSFSRTTPETLTNSGTREAIYTLNPFPVYDTINNQDIYTPPNADPYLLVGIYPLGVGSNFGVELQPDESVGDFYFHFAPYRDYDSIFWHGSTPAQFSQTTWCQAFQLIHKAPLSNRKIDVNWKELWWSYTDSENGRVEYGLLSTDKVALYIQTISHDYSYHGVAIQGQGWLWPSGILPTSAAPTLISDGVPNAIKVEELEFGTCIVARAYSVGTLPPLKESLWQLVYPQNTHFHKAGVQVWSGSSVRSMRWSNVLQIFLPLAIAG